MPASALTGRFAAAPPERLLEMIDLNVRALTELCRLVLPAMVERGRGAILNVASTAAFQAGPNMAVYYASKAYVLSLTEALHQEMKGKGVKVTALVPRADRDRILRRSPESDGIDPREDGDRSRWQSSRPASRASSGTRRSSFPASPTRSAPRHPLPCRRAVDARRIVARIKT